MSLPALGSAIQVERQDHLAGPDGITNYEHLGVALKAKPHFSSTNEQKILGFEISIAYQEIGTSYHVQWVDRSYISTVHEPERIYGPFKNVRGANFRFHVKAEVSGDGPRIDFRLSCDNLELEERYYATYGQPQIELIYGKIDYPGVRLAKDVYTVYSTVSLVYNIGKVATGGVSPQIFLVKVLTSYAISFVVDQIPDHYEGAVSYRCRFCEEVHPLEEIRGCRIVTCCDGIISSEICRVSR